MSARSKNVIEVRGARVRQGAEDLLPSTTLRWPPGELVIALGTPGPTLTALALAVGGRLALSEGSITCDGSADPAVLRRRVALVDLPEVTAPEHGVPVRTVVAEELGFAGRPHGRRAVEAWLGEHGRSDWGSLRTEQVPALERVNALADLATLRPGITHLVLGFPERHGGPPGEWLAVAQRHADAGLGVLLTVSHATATDHDATCVVGAAQHEQGADA